jgi:hypothetical protein
MKRHVVIPAAQQHFARKAVKLEHFGSYSCRNLYGGNQAREAVMRRPTRSTLQASCSKAAGGSRWHETGPGMDPKRGSCGTRTKAPAARSTRCSARHTTLTTPTTTTSTSARTGSAAEAATARSGSINSRWRPQPWPAPPKRLAPPTPRACWHTTAPHRHEAPSCRQRLPSRRPPPGPPASRKTLP